jgi:hypothetical protein
MNPMRVPKTRITAAAAGALIVALLSVTAASAKGPKPPKPHGPGIKVPCAGQAALVAAVDAANSAGGGKLTLAPHCDYQLTSADNGENGLPVVTTGITVNGRHATIDGTDSVRVFEVDGPGGSLSLQATTITGGSAADFGGGIANLGGAVTLDHSQVVGNSAVMAGGGIAQATFDPSRVATLTVRHSSVSGNQQTLTASEDEDNSGLGGGGILNVVGVVTLDHSKVNGNTAEGFVGGGIASGDYFNFSSTDSVLIVEHSRVNGNSAPNAGGGGVQNLLGSATIDHSQVDGNTSLNGGGIASGNAGSPDLTAHLLVKHSKVDGNTATAGPGGEGPPLAAAGIANGSDAVLDHSKVDGNTASHGLGGGIVNHGTLTVKHSEVNRNTAPASGFAGSGGGIFNVTAPDLPAAVLTVDHSRIDRNAAGGFGGGIANGAGPLDGGDVALTHSHLMHNTAAHGGGIFNNGGTVTLSHTKVAHNQVDNCEPTNTIAGCTN